MQVYLSHRSALIDYATPIVRSRAQAEDIVQEAWLRLNGQVSTPNVRSPVSYLYRIVRNLALDHSRRQQIENRQPDSDSVLEALPCGTAQPDATAQHQDTLKKLQQALAQLPERTQRAFILHRLEGLTLKDVSVELGISTSLAHQLVHTALLQCMQAADHD